ncbi:MAG TPA: hypothetical protein VKX28_31985 [Xanthobacteraceae bacterium]|nr:hypothetical protein [Xanthobacteraceae bacterium]
MSTAKKLAWIAAGYALAAVGGFAAVALNELRMSLETTQGSPGMVAFGDMILFVLATGFFGLVPTWFLLKLWAEKAPRALLLTVLLLAVLGPVSWLIMGWLAARTGAADHTMSFGPLLGLLVAFAAIPRIVAGPVLVVIEAATLLLIGGRIVRALLVAAMLMDIVPLGMYLLHMTSRA